MATKTLTLNQPATFTLEATPGNLRELVLPAGARYLEYDSAAAWGYEIAVAQSDGGAGTAANQQSIAAGTGSLRCPGSGSGRSMLVTARSIFLVGTSASQSISLTATSRAP